MVQYTQYLLLLLLLLFLHFSCTLLPFPSPPAVVLGPHYGGPPPPPLLPPQRTQPDADILQVHTLHGVTLLVADAFAPQPDVLLLGMGFPEI